MSNIDVIVGRLFKYRFGSGLSGLGMANKKLITYMKFDLEEVIYL
jgi:hypothetical protein